MNSSQPDRLGFWLHMDVNFVPAFNIVPNALGTLGKLTAG